MNLTPGRSQGMLQNRFLEHPLASPWGQIHSSPSPTHHNSWLDNSGSFHGRRGGWQSRGCRATVAGSGVEPPYWSHTETHSPPMQRTCCYHQVLVKVLSLPAHLPESLFQILL